MGEKEINRCSCTQTSWTCFRAHYVYGYDYDDKPYLYDIAQDSWGPQTNTDAAEAWLNDTYPYGYSIDCWVNGPAVAFSAPSEQLGLGLLSFGMGVGGFMVLLGLGLWLKDCWGDIVFVRPSCFRRKVDPRNDIEMPPQRSNSPRRQRKGSADRVGGSAKTSFSGLDWGIPLHPMGNLRPISHHLLILRLLLTPPHRIVHVDDGVLLGMGEPTVPPQPTPVK